LSSRFIFYTANSGECAGDARCEFDYRSPLLIRSNKKKKEGKIEKKDGRGERAMMNKKLSPIEFYWEYTNREASALVHKELYAQHPPSTPDNSSSLGWMKSKRKEKNQMGGKKKKMNEIQFSTLGRIQKWPQIGN
jgi:hypothetical protein